MKTAASAPLGSAPYWIVISDLHERTERLADIPGLKKADGVLITGDLTNGGGISHARNVLEAVAGYNDHVLSLFGNMDNPEVGPWLDVQGVGLHNMVRELDAHTAILGVGGSNFTPFSTPTEFPDSTLGGWLEDLWPHARTYKRVVLATHCPPRDTLCDMLTTGQHAGSQAVREFIMDCQPDICFCGHIHESRAIERLGRTVVVNPGSLSRGGYAVLHLGPKLTASLHVL